MVLFFMDVVNEEVPERLQRRGGRIVLNTAHFSTE